MGTRPLGLRGCEQVVTGTKTERLTTGIPPGTQTRLVPKKTRGSLAPKEAPAGESQDGAVLRLAAGQSWEVPRWAVS